jgi:hypothetical protein
LRRHLSRDAVPWSIALGNSSRRRWLAACKKHRAKLVIAKLDRLSRNLAFIAALMESGVEFDAVGCRRSQSPETPARRSRVANAGFISMRTRRSSTMTSCIGPS